MNEELTVLPSNERLINGVRKALQKIASRSTDAQTLMELGSADFALSELLLRQQESGFFQDYYGRLYTLLNQGLELVDTYLDSSKLDSSKLDSPAIKQIARDIGDMPPHLDKLLPFDQVGQAINSLLDGLAKIITVLSEGNTGEFSDFLTSVARAEHEFHQHRLESPVAVPPPAKSEGDMKLSAEAMSEYLHQKFPERAGVEVISFKQLVGGYQKTTVLFDIIDANGQQESLVMRAEKEQKFLSLSASEVTTEFQLVRYFHEKGYPVAEPLWLETDKSKLGQKFFVSRKMPGINLGTAKDSKGINDGIAQSFIKAMAQLHKIDVHTDKHRLPLGQWVEYQTLPETTRAYVEVWRDQPWLQNAEPSPLRARVLKWLTDNVPAEDSRLCFIHCDFGPHNVLVESDKVSAVLDWEAVRIGDPAEEISWFLQSSGGIDPAKALKWYEEETGVRLSEFRVAYYDILNLYKQMVSFACAASMYQASPDAGMEWVNFPLRWMAHATTAVEEKIAQADKLAEKLG